MANFLKTLRRVPGLKWLLDNPLLVREIRRRMRGRLFSWSLIAYLVLLGFVSCVIMFVNYPVNQQAISTRELIQSVGNIGMLLFAGLRFVEGAIALLIAPMLTAALATAEKEKDTFDFLRVTTLRPGTFVIGCLLTTACFLVLVFMCTLPILGLTFIFGGVSMADILTFNLVIFLLSMTISAWGIFCSTNYRRSMNVYGSVLVVLFLVFIVVQPLMALFGTRFVPNLWVLFPGGYGWVFRIGGLLLLVFLFGLAAARRLYEPNNRFLNYRQYSALYLLVTGLIGGLLAWRFSPLSGQMLPSATETTDLVARFYLAGWALLGLGILNFSVGRIERGDEVWIIRHRRPMFRRIHESNLFYLFYGAIWLGGTWALAWAGGVLSDFTETFFATVPIMIAGLLLAGATARFVSMLSETRGRAAAGFTALLLLVWVLVPAIGYYFNRVTLMSDGTAQILYELSPLAALMQAEQNAGELNVIRSTVLILIMAGLLTAATMLEPLKRRYVVAYD